MLKNKMINGMKVLSCLLILLLLTAILSKTAFSNRKAAPYSNRYANAYAYYYLPDHTVDMIGIGNSNLYSGVIPMQLWEEYGYTAALSCAPKQTLLQSCYRLEDILKTQSPSLLLIETDMFYDDLPSAEKELPAEEYVPAARPALFDACQPERFEDALAARLPLLTFHDKWKGVLRHLAGKENNAWQPCTHGYRLSLATVPFETVDYMTPTEKIEPISNIYLKDIDRLLTLCDEHNITPVLISTPSPAAWSSARHNAVAALAAEKELLYLDYNEEWPSLSLAAQSDFRDEGIHLNYYGAEKLSAALGETLQATGLLSDRRTDSGFDSYEEDAVAFRELVTAAQCQPISNMPDNED